MILTFIKVTFVSQYNQNFIIINVSTCQDHINPWAQLTFFVVIYLLYICVVIYHEVKMYTWNKWLQILIYIREYMAQYYFWSSWFLSTVALKIPAPALVAAKIHRWCRPPAENFNATVDRNLICKRNWNTMYRSLDFPNKHWFSMKLRGLLDAKNFGPTQFFFLFFESPWYSTHFG